MFHQRFHWGVNYWGLIFDLLFASCWRKYFSDLVQNLAVRLLTRSERSDGITSVLASCIDSLYVLKLILRAYCWLLRLYMVSPQVIYLSFSLHMSQKWNLSGFGGRSASCSRGTAENLEVIEHFQLNPQSSGMSCLRKSCQQKQWPLLNSCLKPLLGSLPKF